MKPVDQTMHHDPDVGAVGDCFRCCIASLLELPAAEVPHFFEYTKDPAQRDDGEPGIEALQRFLASFGLYYCEIPMTAEDYDSQRLDLDCHYVLSGQSPRDVPHSVVARNGAVVHDPHPSWAGVQALDGVYLVGLLVKL